MSNLLLIIVSLIYLGVSINLLVDAKYGMSLAFIAYAVSNIGFVLANRGI